MIDLILIVIAVMFGTLLLDKNKRPKYILKENFNGFTPSYKNFINNYQNGGFNPYTLNKSMETYQPIDYDNNVASIYGYKSDGYDTTPKQTIATCTPNDGLLGSNRWCNCEILSSNGTTETSTRRLIGGVNPKTLIAPQITPPITDIQEWGTDNYTIHSATNNHRSDELFLSGYVTLDNCKCKGRCHCKKHLSKPFIKESFDQNFISPFDLSEQRESRPQILQNYGISNILEKPLYTSITDGNDMIFTEQKQLLKNSSNNFYDDPSTIYDPRMVGYSDSQRGYIDRLLGQPKFYYDDINAARAPNYISRNKIDIYAFGESTGRLKNPKNVYGDNNQLAVEEFHNSTLQHRSDLMQSLMNKRNGEMWQLRQYPISTNGQRMSGGTSKI